MLAVVLFVGCLATWLPALNFGQYVDAALVWAAAVSANVFVLAVDDAVTLAAVTVWHAALAAAVLTSRALGHFVDDAAAVV